MKFAQQILSKYYGEVTLTSDKFLMLAHMLDLAGKLRSFCLWDMEIDIIPQEKISHTIKYQKAFWKYVENKYCAKHQQMSVIKLKTILGSNYLPSSILSAFRQSSFDPYDLFLHDEESIIPQFMATPGRREPVAC